MASSSKRKEDKGPRENKLAPEAQKARLALIDGDFRAARALAQRVLSSAEASEGDKREADDVMKATSIDWAPVVVGLAVFSVLLFLFIWAYQHHPGS